MTTEHLTRQECTDASKQSQTIQKTVNAAVGRRFARCTAPIRLRPGGVFDYVSASRLNLWLKCPLAFRLKYIDGIRFPTPPAIFLGKQVHAALEWYYRNRQLDRNVSAADVHAVLLSGWSRAAEEEDMRFPSTDEEAGLQSKAIELVRAYLSKVAAERIRPLAVETALEAPWLIREPART